MIGRGGIGTYIQSVLPAVMELRPEWTFSVLGNNRVLEQALPTTPARWIECTAPIYGVREQLALARLIPPDTSVFWAPHYNIPLLRRVPLAVTIHDVAHLRLPEYASPARRLYARTLFHAVKRRAAAVMFSSDFSRREFFDLVGHPRGQAETVHLGLTSDWTNSMGQADLPPIEGRYYVYVGNAKPHKNLKALLDAFVHLRGQIDARLVIIGETDGLRTADATIVERLRTTAGVQMLGTVPQSVLHSFVAHATALVLPSLYEGFGLPPVEAMAVGCPAIVARAASLPEVCGDGAAYFEPSNSLELAGVMRRVATDPAFRESLVSRGYGWVRQFDVRRTATRVEKVLEAVALGARRLPSRI